MKKILLLSIISIYSLSQLKAQESTTKAFMEWNLGVAQIYNDGFFPGTSVLWGRTHVSTNNVIFEYEIGLAAPTIATAKLGVGLKIHNTLVTVGIRPIPSNLYLQTSLFNREKGNWIISAEINPLGEDSPLSFDSNAVFNFGYRWNLKRSK